MPGTNFPDFINSYYETDSSANNSDDDGFSFVTSTPSYTSNYYFNLLDREVRDRILKESQYISNVFPHLNFTWDEKTLLKTNKELSKTYSGSIKVFDLRGPGYILVKIKEYNVTYEFTNAYSSICVKIISLEEI